MRIYRYLFREVSNSFVAVALVLLLIFVSGRFVKYLSEVASGTISSKVLFSILFYRMPGFMELILPLALFLGVMLAYGRLYVESEMVVLQACGVSKRRLLLYTQGPALVVMLLVAMFSLYLTPLGWKNFHRIWNDPETYSGLGTMVAGSFKKFDSQNVVVYTAEMNSQKTRLTEVFVVKSSDDPKDHTLVLIKAEAAEVVTEKQGEPFIELYNGVQYSGEPGKLEFNATRYEIYGQRLREPQKAGVRVSSVDGTPTLSLFGSSDVKEQAALYWRFAMPFIVPIIALIALALSETNHRKGRYTKLLPGFLVYIFYIGLLIAVRSEMEKGSQMLGAATFALVHLLFLLLGLVLLYYNQIKMRFTHKEATS